MQASAAKKNNKKKKVLNGNMIGFPFTIPPIKVLISQLECGFQLCMPDTFLGLLVFLKVSIIFPCRVIYFFY